MKAWSRLALGVLVVVVGGAACQNTEQSAVQPEKLASSSPSESSESPPATGGPLIPYASGHGPSDLAAPSASTKVASKDPEPDTDEFNPDGPAATPPPKAAPKPPAPKATPGVVKLIKPGAAPLSELRLTPKVGDTSSVEMVMTTAISMEIDGKKPPTGTVPPIVFVMTTKITEIEPSGDIHYTLDVIDAGVRAIPGVQAEVITALNQALGSLVGLTGKVTLTDRGITKETKLSLPGVQNAQTQQVLQGMEQAMQQLGAPLPEEAVGKGAQWTHTTNMTQNGITMTQVATYDLVKVKGKKITCKVSLAQSAPKQKVASPVGVVVDLLSLTSKGGGTTKLSLDQLTPIQSKVKVDTKASMALPKGQKMKMDSSLTVEMGKPKKKPKVKTPAAPKSVVPTPPKTPAPVPAPAPTPPPTAP